MAAWNIDSDSVLFRSVQEGTTDEEKKLFNDCSLDDASVPPLNVACASGDLDEVRALLNAGADPNTPGPEGKTPIHYICDGGENREDNYSDLLEIVELLIRSGAGVDVCDNLGCTPIYMACESDDIDMVKMLVRAGCNVNIQTVCGASPMKMACRNAKFWSYWHSRHHGGTSSNHGNLDPNNFPPVQITKVLLQANADISEATLLPTAVQFGSLKLVQELLDLGMDVNMLDDNMCTPLGSACSSTSVSCEVVKLLLDWGADVNKGGGWKKQKPLIFAYVHNSVAKTCLLLSYGARITPDEMTELVSLTLSKSILENPEVIGPRSKELLSWRLLLAAGFVPVIHGTQLANKVHQLSMCSSYEKIGRWILTLLFPLRSLKDSCRIVIRNALPIEPTIDSSIRNLPLPKKLQEYLMFSEFASFKQSL